MSPNKELSIAFSLSHTLQNTDKGVYVFSKDELLRASGHDENLRTPGASVKMLVNCYIDVLLCRCKLFLFFQPTNHKLTPIHTRPGSFVL